MTGGVNDIAPRRTVVHPAVWARICEMVDRTPSPFLDRVRREAAEREVAELCERYPSTSERREIRFESVSFDEMQDYPMEETTTFTADGVVQWGADDSVEPFERDETLLANIGGALDGCWLMLLAYLGGRRGLVSPKCYEGLRSHGYVAKVASRG